MNMKSSNKLVLLFLVLFYGGCATGKSISKAEDIGDDGKNNMVVMNLELQDYDRAPSVLIRDLSLLADTFDWYDRVREEQPDVYPVFELDNAHQAHYTSNHILDHLSLERGIEAYLTPDEIITYDENRLAPPKALRSAITANLRRISADTNPNSSDWHSHKFRAVDVANFVVINKSLDLLDPKEPLKAWLVPAETSPDAWCILPNGYFAGSFKPPQNYVIAQWLKAHLDLDLFGVNDRYAAYIRKAPIQDKDWVVLRPFLESLYIDTEDKGLFEKLSQSIIGGRTVVIQYDEGD